MELAVVLRDLCGVKDVLVSAAGGVSIVTTTGGGDVAGIKFMRACATRNVIVTIICSTVGGTANQRHGREQSQRQQPERIISDHK